VRSLSHQDDITPIAAEEYVRANVSRFFASGHFTPEEVAGHLVVEALLSHARCVEVRQVERWWVVRSDVDWLPPPLDDQAFRALVPFPEGGPNAARREILLGIFATDVALGGVDGPRIIKGQLDDGIHEFLVGDGDYRRSVAFRE
jgi:hypothetical protein